MVGTLPKIWPWKETLTWRTNSKGEQVPLIEQNLSPFEFEAITSQPAQLTVAVVLMLCGIGLVLGLEKLGEHK
jgi:putative membrane protein